MIHSNEIGFLLGKATRLMRWNINKMLSDTGVTFPQMMVIKYLYRNQKERKDISFNTPAMIAEQLEFDRPTVTGILTRLDTQGWIIRGENIEDRRSKIITLTEKSNELMKRFCRILDDLNTEILQGFPASEIKALENTLLKIIDKLEYISP